MEGASLLGSESKVDGPDAEGTDGRPGAHHGVRKRRASLSKSHGGHPLSLGGGSAPIASSTGASPPPKVRRVSSAGEPRHELSAAAKCIVAKAQIRFIALLKKRAERMAEEKAEQEKRAKDPFKKCRRHPENEDTKGLTEDETHELGKIFDIVGGEDATMDTDEFDEFFDGLEDAMNDQTFRERLWRMMGPEATADGEIDKDEFLIGIEVAFMQMGSNSEHVIKTLGDLFTAKAGGEEEELDEMQFIEMFEKRLPDEFVRRVFRIFDEDGGGSLNGQEFINSIDGLINGSWRDHLTFAFKLMDENGDGLIDVNEWSEAVQKGLKKNKLHLTAEVVDDMQSAFFNTDDFTATVGPERLIELVSGDPSVLKNLKFDIAETLMPPEPGKKKKFEMFSAGGRPRAKNKYVDPDWLSNNVPKVFTLCLYVGVHIGLFAWVFTERLLQTVNDSAYWGVIVARVGGMWLNFNCALIIIPMCRASMTMLRGSIIDKFIPMDEAISFHKTIGKVLFCSMVVHVVGWLIIALKYSLGVDDDFTKPYYLADSSAKNPRTFGDYNSPAKFEAWRFLFWYQKGWFGLISGVAGPTGSIITVLFTTLFFFAYGPTRRKWYLTFFFTHLLYIPMQILLVFHCERYWYFACVPFTIFLTEKLIGLVFQKGKYTTHLVSATCLPGNVTRLEIFQPSTFKYKPGFYAFIRIKFLNQFEYHPFTISSSPLEKNFTMHVRKLGDWTGDLNNFIKERHDKGLEDSQVAVECHGPYGAASDAVFEVDHAILCSAGIGVTPFASVLKTLALRQASCVVDCPQCAHEFEVEALLDSGGSFTVKRVDFVWINRSAGAFEWFVEMLLEVEELKRRFPKMRDYVHLHTYLTGLKPADMKSLILCLSLQAYFEKHKTDAITGCVRSCAARCPPSRFALAHIFVRSHARRSRAAALSPRARRLEAPIKCGRPNWDKVFRGMMKGNSFKNRCVFFCGPNALKKALMSKCDKYNIGFRAETF